MVLVEPYIRSEEDAYVGIYVGSGKGFDNGCLCLDRTFTDSLSLVLLSRFRLVCD